MNIKSLPIKLVRQDPGSDDCLRCCALMVLQYFDQKISKDEVWKKLHVYQKHSGLEGAFFTDLGKLALSKNYHASISHGDWHWWDKLTVEALRKTKSTFIKALKNLRQAKSDWAERKIINKEINFVRKGGKFHFSLPRLEIIDNLLNRKIPPILAVRAEDLYHDPKNNHTATIVVTGKENGKYFIKDPYWAVDGVSSEELYTAWVRNGGWLLAIEPDSKPQPQLPLFEKENKR